MPAAISVGEIVILASTDGIPREETGGRYLPLMHTQQKLQVIAYRWNPDSLAFEPETTPETAGGKTITYVPVNQGAAGTTQLAAASATKKHKVLGVVITMSATGSLKFLDSSGDLTGPMDIASTGGFVLPTSSYPYFETGAINRSLSITTTGGAARGVVALLTEA